MKDSSWGRVISAVIAGVILWLLTRFVLVPIFSTEEQTFSRPPNDTTAESTQTESSYPPDEISRTSQKNLDTPDPAEEQYTKGILYIEEGYYKAALDIFLNLLDYKDVQEHLYNLAVNMDNSRDYFLAADIYKVLMKEGFQDTQDKYNYLIGNSLPIELYVGSWTAIANKITYKLIVFRDGQNDYYFEFYNEPDEPDYHRDQKLSYSGKVKYNDNGGIVCTPEVWIDRPKNSLAVQYSLGGDDYFSKIDKSTIIMSAPQGDDIIFTRIPE